MGEARPSIAKTTPRNEVSESPIPPTPIWGSNEDGKQHETECIPNDLFPRFMGICR